MDSQSALPPIDVPLSAALSAGLILLCPLLHLIVMRGMPTAPRSGTSTHTTSQPSAL